MGMTIDEAIEIINHYLDYPQEEVRKALLLAINTMRKYQKIEQIYKEWFSDAGHTSAEAYGRIGEVLKNGNVD